MSEPSTSTSGAVAEQSRRRWLMARIALGVVLLLIGLVELTAGNESQHRYGVVLSVLGIGNVGIALFKLKSGQRE
jgi:hypothetical protein